METPDPHESLPVRLGLAIHGICRGCAVVILALALYVALTNWEGSGSVWAFRYAGIALALYLVGHVARVLLAGMR